MSPLVFHDSNKTFTSDDIEKFGVCVKIDYDKVISRSQWIVDMREWAHQHDIEILWAGESSHSSVISNTLCRWHEAEFVIFDDYSRTMFTLAWS